MFLSSCLGAWGLRKHLTLFRQSLLLMGLTFKEKLPVYYGGICLAYYHVCRLEQIIVKEFGGAIITNIGIVRS